jgi:hypothetical protein
MKQNPCHTEPSRSYLDKICFLPVLIVSLALGFDVLGEDLSYTSGGWCWITECNRLPRATKLAWMLATGKFWEFATYIILIINYAMLKFVVWKRVSIDTAFHSHVILL